VDERVCMTIGRAFECASKSLPDYAAVRSTYLRAEIGAGKGERVVKA
jgi:hypothetical protein